MFGGLLPITGGSYLAGEIVARALHALHVMGIICGLVLLLCLTILRKTIMHAANFLVLLMLFLTYASQFVVTPRIEQIRLAAYANKQEPVNNEEFNKLHHASVALEGGVLLLGLAMVWLVARDSDTR